MICIEACCILPDGHSSPYNDSPYSHEGPSPVSAGFPVTSAIGHTQTGMLQVLYFVFNLYCFVPRCFNSLITILLTIL